MTDTDDVKDALDELEEITKKLDTVESDEYTTSNELCAIQAELVDLRKERRTKHSEIRKMLNEIGRTKQELVKRFRTL